MAAAVQRSAIEADRHRFTLRQTRRTVLMTFSTMLVQASARRSSFGRPSRVTVRISPRPSRMLADTPGASCSSRRARLRISFSVTWLRTAQNLINIVAGAPEHVREVSPIDEATRFEAPSKTVHRWQSRGERQTVDANPVGNYEWVGHDVERMHAPLDRPDGGCDIFCLPDFEHRNLDAECAGSSLSLAYLQQSVGIAGICHDRQPAET